MARLRHLLLPCGLVFAVTLAVIIGQRLSAEAMAVLVGVLAGVAASIPTSLIVVWLATRSLRAVESVPVDGVGPQRAEAAEPRVVYVTPQSMAAAAAAYQTLSAYAPPAPPLQPPAGVPALRQFTVIGGLEPQLDGNETPTEVIWPR